MAILSEKVEEPTNSFCLRMPEKLKIDMEFLSKSFKRSMNKQIVHLLEKFVEENREILSDRDIDEYSY